MKRQLLILVLAVQKCACLTDAPKQSTTLIDLVALVLICFSFLPCARQTPSGSAGRECNCERQMLALLLLLLLFGATKVSSDLISRPSA